MSGDRAPDLAEPLLGWRLWRLSERPGGTVALVSVVRRVEWPTRRELDATCLGPQWTWRPRRRREHRAPEQRCRCGIYAAAGVEQALTYLEVCRGVARRRPPAALGVVKLWGRVLECERGWRGTHAYPARLYVLGPEPPEQYDPWRLARGLAGYGVPVDVLDAQGEQLIDLLVGRREQVTFEAPTPPAGP
jgi:hypothetical protein